MTLSQIITEDQLDFMHLEKNNNASQRLIAKNTGLSIRKADYFLKVFIDFGFAKIHSFKKSTKKINHAYVLTPKGIKEKQI